MNYPPLRPQDLKPCNGSEKLTISVELKIERFLKTPRKETKMIRGMIVPYTHHSFDQTIRNFDHNISAHPMPMSVLENSIRELSQIIRDEYIKAGLVR